MQIFLTCLFAGIWNGSFFHSIAFVVAFTTTIVLSWVLSSWLCWWLERSLDLIIIDCGDDKERLAITRALAAMPDVLVESTTSGYQYTGGYRIDSGCGAGHVPLRANNNSETAVRRAVGFVFGVLLGLFAAVVAGLVLSIIGIPAYAEFFPPPDSYTPALVAAPLGFMASFS
jgi:multidrug efflux pump subunit AcrB